MEITLRIPNHKIVLSVDMKRINTYRKDIALAEEIKKNQILEGIEKEREYAINNLYLMY